jgi:hypothetical protein
MIKGSDPLEVLCRSKPSNYISPKIDAPSWKLAPLEESMDMA